MELDLGSNICNIVSKSHLSRYLGIEVLSFDVKPGSKPGEGYTSVHFAIKVELINGSLRHLFLKCFPEHPIRQETHKSSNIFFKEFKFYTEMIPDFENFQKEIFKGEIPIKFSIPEFISGNAIDYFSDITNFDGVDHLSKNYILMADMKLEHGFKNLPTFHRLNLEEALKIIDELAKFHVVSWAIKQKFKLKTLSERYPYLIENIFIDDNEFEQMVKKNVKISTEIISDELGLQSDIVKSIKSWFQMYPDPIQVCHDFIRPGGIDEVKSERYLRKSWPSGLTPPIEDSWTVLTQTDLWINNILFKFGNGVLEKALLLDFQYTRETCPTIELAILLYICADADFRQKYIPEILEYYHQKISSLCSVLCIEPYPNFNLENLQRRFHRARIYGTLNALWFLPILFTDPSQLNEIEESNELKNIPTNSEQTFPNVKAGGWVGTPFRKAIRELAEEAFNLGIF